MALFIKRKLSLLCNHEEEIIEDRIEGIVEPFEAIVHCVWFSNYGRILTETQYRSETKAVFVGFGCEV